MPSPAEDDSLPHRPTAKPSSKGLVRGSTLLILGRLVSKTSNFATQLLLVRYLARSSYGEFAYALSLVTVVQTIITLGLDKSIPRFLPIYHEHRDRAKLLGTIALTVVTITLLGLVAALGLYGGIGIAKGLIHDEKALGLLLVLIFLAPLQALDDVLVGLFAVFAKPRAIFFRRYVLAPALKFATVVLLILSHSSLVFLAGGYLLSSLIGVTIYGFLVIRLLREAGLLGDGAWRNMVVPWREVFGFTLPLLVTDVVPIAVNTVSIVLLAHFWNTSSVADLRAVQPAAKLNELVFSGFSTLFTPAAARLFATNDRERMNRLYWHTAVWIAVLSFPMFAVTFSLAEPVTVFLYGERYRQAAPILAMLSLAYYFNAATGFNGLTLKAFGKVRFMIIISLVTIVVSAALGATLIPRLGAIGAGIAMMTSVSLFNALKQVGLRFGTGVHLFDWYYAWIYALIVLCAGALMIIQMVTQAPVFVSAAVAAVMSVALVTLSAKHLEVSRTFPEILRVPGMRFLVSSDWAIKPSPNGRPAIRHAEAAAAAEVPEAVPPQSR